MYFEKVPGSDVSLSPSTGSKSEAGPGDRIGVQGVYFEKDEWTFLNELTEADYIYLNREAEAQIRKAAEQSDLIELASTNGNKMVDMMRFITEASGWSFEIIGMDSIPQKNFNTFE